MDKMHYNVLSKLVDKYVLDNHLTVVEFGSRDCNGSTKDLFYGKNYVGVDITHGRNVDVVMKTEFDSGMLDNFSDVIISTSCLEHCSNPFKLVKEMSRILKANGIIILSVPQVWGEHRYPKDYWRIMPDGMKELMASNSINTIDVFTKSKITIRHGIMKATFGVGIK